METHGLMMSVTSPPLHLRREMTVTASPHHITSVLRCFLGRTGRPGEGGREGGDGFLKSEVEKICNL